MRKKEAQLLLGYKTIRSIELLMNAGKLTFTKEPMIGNWKGSARVEITGSTDPKIQAKLFPPKPDPRILVKPVVPKEYATPEVDVKNMTPEEKFAAQYLAGEIPDSCGNYHDGPLRTSLLGPHNPMPRPVPDATAHMDPALIGSPGRDRVENPVDSDDYQELLHPGFKDRKSAMYASCGVKQQPSEQQNKQRNDIAMIKAAFRTGQWSR